MPRIFGTALFLSLILCACSLGGPFPAASSPAPAADAPTSDILPVITKQILPLPKLVATLSTPHIEQGPDGPSTVSPSYPEGCGYQWAYQDLPELSGEFLSELQTLQPEAQGNAFAFGENCLGADGTVQRFIPMETDFNITLHVTDLADESDLGEWIVKVMDVIESIPPDQIIGPRPGRVNMVFQSSGGQKVVSFYIDQYRALPPGLSNADIYQALQTK